MNPPRTPGQVHAYLLACVCTFLSYLPASAQQLQRAAEQVESTWAAAVPSRLLRENIELVQLQNQRVAFPMRDFQSVSEDKPQG